MKKKPRAREPLSHDRVLRAALALADEAGVDALSMRKLASVLGVEAMSLYKHVASKEQLLDGVVDLIVAEIRTAKPGSPWRPALRARAIAIRAALQRRPWALPLMQDLKPTPARLRDQDNVLGLMREQGFSLQAAYRGFLLMDSFVYGFLIQELSWTAEDQDAVSAMQLGAVSETYPYFSEVLGHVTGLVTKAGAAAAYDAEFKFGLEQILDALDRLGAPR